MGISQSLEPQLALARLLAVFATGDAAWAYDPVRLDALGLGAITPLLAGAAGGPDLAEICLPFRRAGETASRVLLLALAEGVAGAHPVEMRERALFHRVASLLGLRVADATDVLALADRELADPETGGDPHAADARRLLGLEPDASADAVDAAYLSRVARFSPAGVVSLGAGAVAFAMRWLSEFTLARETLLARLDRNARCGEPTCRGDETAGTTRPSRRRCGCSASG